MNPKTRRLRRHRELQKRKSALGVEARARKRQAEANAACIHWPVVGLCLLRITAAPDGRHAALEVAGQFDCTIVGTHRAMVSQLSKIITAAIRRHKARK